MRESEIQKQILTWLKARGILCWKTHMDGVRIKGGRGTNPMKGFPDLFGLLPTGVGRAFAIEVKAPKGQLSPEQVSWREKLEAKGVIYVLARSLDDAMEIERRSMWP